MQRASRSSRRWWAVLGAVILMIGNAVWARLAGGAEWTDPALYMAPIAAIVGAGLGYGLAVLVERRTR